MQEEKLLKAIADMLDQKLEQKLDQKLQPVWQELNSLNKRVDTVSEQINTLDKRFHVLEEKVDILTKRVDVLEEKVDVLTKRVDVLDEKVTRNYDLVLEFYGRQQEENCYLRDELKLFYGILKMQGAQIARNTADIDELKGAKEAKAA